MKIVRNIGQACVLACIESFFSDIRSPKTQKELIAELLPKKLCDENGVVFLEKFQQALDALGLYSRQIPFHHPVDHVYWDGSLFLISTIGGRHCVRFYDQLVDGRLLVMDPNYHEETFRYMDKKELVEKGYQMFRLKLLK